MKNLLKFGILTAIVVAVLIIAGCFTTAGGDEVDTEITFTLNSDGESYTLTNVGKDIYELVIPAEYEGLPVTAIGSRAFYNVYYPSGCASPKEYFANLSSLTIPASVKTVKPNTFYGIHVEKIYYEGTAAEWCAIDFGESVFGEETALYIGGEEVTEIFIDGVEEVSAFAFAGYNRLLAASFGGSVTRLGNSAFAGCENLERADISQAAVKIIGANAFAGCLKLTAFTLPETVEEIGDNAFSGCANIFEIFNYSYLVLEEGSKSYGGIAANAILIHTEKDDGLSLKTVDDFAFILGGETPFFAKLMTETAEATLPENIDGQAYSLKEGAFKNQTCLESVTLPNFLISISPYAFYGCKNLVTLRCGNIEEVGAYAFCYCENLENFDFSQVEKLGEYAFYSCRGLTALNLSDELTEIPQFAFGVCDGLSELVLPENLIAIKENAFVSSKSLQEVTVLSRNAVLEGDAFGYCPALESAVIAAADIRTRAFEYSKNLSSVTLCDGVGSVNVNAFYGTSVTSLCFPASCENIALDDIGIMPNYTTDEVSLADGNAVYAYSGGCIIDIERKTVVIASDFATVPDDGSAEIIGTAAFYRRKLGEVILPACVTEVKAGAFAESTVTRIEMVGVTGVGLEAFSRCKSLTEVVFGDGLAYLRRAFNYCVSLTYIEIPDSCKSLESNSFYGCTSLERVKLPSSITAIPDYCFRDCVSLKEIVIPDGVTQVGIGAFRNCTALESVTLPVSVKSLLSYSFYETAAEEFVFEGTVAEWETVYKGAAARWVEREVKVICTDGECIYKED